MFIKNGHMVKGRRALETFQKQTKVNQIQKKTMKENLPKVLVFLGAELTCLSGADKAISNEARATYTCGLAVPQLTQGIGIAGDAITTSNLCYGHVLTK